MIAFQFIPSTVDVASARRVDFASLAGQFGEGLEIVPMRNARQTLARLAMAALILLGALGDMVLIAQREALAGCLASGSHVVPVQHGTTS